MTMRVFIVLAQLCAALAISEGTLDDSYLVGSETCKANGDSCVTPQDDVQLMQLRAEVRQHSKWTTKTDMHEVMASFAKKHGPGALQQLVQGVITAPALKTKEAMRAALHARPQLQYLAQRYPDFWKMQGTSIFEDPQAIQQIKAAVLNEHRLPKMQGGHPSKKAHPSFVSSASDLRLKLRHLRHKRSQEVRKHPTHKQISTLSKSDLHQSYPGESWHRRRGTDYDPSKAEEQLEIFKQDWEHLKAEGIVDEDQDYKDWMEKDYKEEDLEKVADGLRKWSGSKNWAEHEDQIYLNETGWPSLGTFPKQQSAYIFWIEGEGCDAKLGFKDFPAGKVDTKSHPIFKDAFEIVDEWGDDGEYAYKFKKGPIVKTYFPSDCTGHPWIHTMFMNGQTAVRRPNSVQYLFSKEQDGKTLLAIGYLGAFGSDPTGYPAWPLSADNAVLTTAAFTETTEDLPSELFYIEQSGNWPNFTYSLMRAAWDEREESLEAAENGEKSWDDLWIVERLAGIKGCTYPSNMMYVPQADPLVVAPSGYLIWACSKDWNDPNDTAKIMKYSLKSLSKCHWHKFCVSCKDDSLCKLWGLKDPAPFPFEEEGYLKMTPEILPGATLSSGFGPMAFSGSKLYYTIYQGDPTGYSGTYQLYSCELDKCVPEKVGEIPGSSEKFLVDGSGDVITFPYTSWQASTAESPIAHWTTYNVTSTNLATAKSEMLFEIGGTDDRRYNWFLYY